MVQAKYLVLFPPHQPPPSIIRRQGLFGKKEDCRCGPHQIIPDEKTSEHSVVCICFVPRIICIVFQGISAGPSTTNFMLLYILCPTPSILLYLFLSFLYYCIVVNTFIHSPFYPFDSTALLSREQVLSHLALYDLYIYKPKTTLIV